MKKLQKNWLEWSCFAVSLLLVSGVIGYLAYDAATAGDAPPDIHFQLNELQPQSNGTFRIDVTAENRGDRTAEGVLVEVVLKNAGREERAEFTIDYLPRHGKRQGYVTFTVDPRAAESVRARAVGYAKP